MGKKIRKIETYDPKTVELYKLAELLLNLSPQQKEELELLLDREAMEILKASEEDIKKGRTIPIDQW